MCVNIMCKAILHTKLTLIEICFTIVVGWKKYYYIGISVTSSKLSRSKFKQGHGFKYINA